MLERVARASPVSGGVLPSRRLKFAAIACSAADLRGLVLVLGEGA